MKGWFVLNLQNWDNIGWWSAICGAITTVLGNCAAFSCQLRKVDGQMTELASEHYLRWSLNGDLQRKRHILATNIKRVFLINRSTNANHAWSKVANSRGACSWKNNNMWALTPKDVIFKSEMKREKKDPSGECVFHLRPHHLVLRLVCCNTCVNVKLETTHNDRMGWISSGVALLIVFFTQEWSIPKVILQIINNSSNNGVIFIFS